MKKKFAKLLSILLTIFLLWGTLTQTVCAENNTFSAQTGEESIDITAPSAILMEATTGTICYAKDAQKQLPMASVTKVMTLLLIFEAIEDGKLTLDQQIAVSDHAASMGGSQVFLEPGEMQTVDTLIKCISVASANDASVAMAEAVAGTEEQFVTLMNQRARELHMEHTNFVNCCGLDHKDHYSCAKDLALVSRALITTHPQIYDYCKIWQEDITHTTKKGSTPFTLTNTNKLLKQYPYATGLKTGSTSVAKFCLAATAKKDGLEFIAVIMAAETPKDRFRDATKLLEYGFANTAIYRDAIAEKDYSIPVIKGTKQDVAAQPQSDFSFLAMNGEKIADIKKKEVLPKKLQAPLKKGTAVGKIEYYIGDNKIGSVPVIAKSSVKKATYSFYIKYLFYQLSLSDKK